ncbi:peptidyl-prolyl cis-trans isomerase FKBP62-like isoform X1 [Cynara cardunculus var. scolymus]|uniref:peptidyl-prolyl cis-trans isomerase FKBP62-like isoform X1 n=1 Tax=Cynara cardunculus var. scolymus TaxID=59895 RepID=UPI000D6278B3|nr:peptidyl-prolyl cis-trans isomerase FKBP62-like isoform X1 [Cynara cardunculus var. scolymus]XP_024963220.1 peptidyl-prolyl cis-trans isomerase FKBP62-like isoform X1 [Cynara cardunculus var. scolymus]
MVEENKRRKISDMAEDPDSDEEPGEVIESAPPLRVGEERVFNSTGLKKKLLRRGVGFETPECGDEPTVHYVGTLLDGTTFISTRDKGEPFTFKIGQDQVCSGFDQAVLTMKKGEIALFTLPPQLGFGAAGTDGVPPNSFIYFEVELISWITVVDVCKDGGILKRVVKKGEQTGQPGDLDEVKVRYVVTLLDGVTVAESPNEGVEFYLKDGHFCMALPKAIKTMTREEKADLIVQPQYAFGGGVTTLPNGCSPIPPDSALRVALELLSFKPVVDVTNDLKVVKKILKEGEGALTANEGASVIIRYRAMLENGTVFEKKGYDGETSLSFITDEEQVIAGLDRAVATMKKGEKATLTIGHEYGYGSKEVMCDLAVIPPFSTLVYEVEVIDFEKEKAPWEMANHERIEEAGKKKEEGNVLFKNGKYQRAAKKYDKAVDYVSEEGLLGDDVQKLVKSLRVSCWLNGAACSLKLNDYQEAIKLCSKLEHYTRIFMLKFQQVLDVEFYNVKALYRRAQAYMKTYDLQLAELDIKKALEADPQSREVKSIQTTLKQLQAESNKRDLKLYTNMFARMAKDCSLGTTKRPKLEKVDKDQRDGIMEMELEKVDSEMAVDSSS